MKKNILFSKEARDKVQIGANLIADAVSVTLGPQGRNVLISESYLHDYDLRSFPIRATKDGVSVARCVKSEDQIENVGVLLLREASEKTMLQAGDGTTTTVVLARAILNEGLKLVDAGANPMELKKGIDAAVAQVVEQIKAMAVPVNGDIEKVRQIATIAANNDSSIGDLIADTFMKIGFDGVIDIEEAKSVNTEIKLIDGFTFDKGWLSPMFITNPSKQECELMEPYILLYDRNITTMKQIIPILNQVASESKPLVIICDDVDGEALAFLAVNTAQRKIQACAIRAPFIGEQKRELMEDLAAATGATFTTDLKGVAIENLKITHLGKAQKIIVSKEKTTIINGEKNKAEFRELYNNLKMNAVDAKSDEEKQQIEARIARLTGSVAVIMVGAATEVEMKEKKDRVDDSIRAAKSAMAEGYVPGGGTAFIRAISNLAPPTDDYKKGYLLLGSILNAPLNQICLNAGVKDKLLEVIAESGYNIGYNAKTNKVEDLVASGVIDPVKVLRCSLQNAASVAGVVLTAEAMIVDSLN